VARSTCCTRNGCNRSLGSGFPQWSSGVVSGAVCGVNGQGSALWEALWVDLHDVLTSGSWVGNACHGSGKHICRLFCRPMLGQVPWLHKGLFAVSSEGGGYGIRAEIGCRLSCITPWHWKEYHHTDQVSRRGDKVQPHNRPELPYVKGSRPPCLTECHWSLTLYILNFAVNDLGKLQENFGTIR
jgi:hypothetical protein